MPKVFFDRNLTVEVEPFDSAKSLAQDDKVEVEVEVKVEEGGLRKKDLGIRSKD